MKRFVTLLLLCCTFAGSQAQDPDFTQFYANKLYLNPAFAGTNGGPRFSLNYRNQWPSVQGNFVTYSASYDQHFDAIGGGVGLQVWHDQAGEGNLQTTTPSLSYSYHLNVNEDFTVKAALQASYYQKTLGQDFKFGDQINPQRGFVLETAEPIAQNGDQQVNFADFSAGFMGFTDQFYGGFAVHHISEPNVSFYDNPDSELPRKYTGHVGMMLPLDNTRDPERYISPNILFQSQGPFTQFNFGAYYKQRAFVIGGYFRQTGANSDAFMGLVGLHQDKFKIGYSYDVTVSDARTAARGSHEVSLIIELESSDRRQVKKWRSLNCPDF